MSNTQISFRTDLKPRIIAMCEAENMGVRQFFEALFLRYEAGNLENTGESSETAARIQQLETQRDQLADRIHELENRTPEVVEKEVIKEVIKEVPATEPAPAQLKKGEILVKTGVKEYFALEITQGAVFEETGEKVSKADVLLNLFVQYFGQGVGDWLPITNKHRRNYAEKLNQYSHKIKTETPADEPANP